MSTTQIAILCLALWVCALHYLLYQVIKSVKNLYESMLTMLKTQKSQQEIDASLLSMVQTLSKRQP